VNEDACLVGGPIGGGNGEKAARVRIEDDGWIVAVSDGIGGHRAGAVASLAVVEILAECRRATPAGVRDILQDANRRLWERGMSDPECRAMGATVAGIACGGKGLFAFNVGDSRVYRFSRKRLTQVTHDDSEAEELIRQGLLPRDGGVRPGYLHALTQALGGREQLVEIKPHVHALSVASSARFLVCTDGVTDMIEFAVIERILAEEKDAAAVTEALFRRAMENGGADNITLTVVDVVKCGGHA
jgi:serine/threonine protein phosphatase PrpC